MKNSLTAVCLRMWLRGDISIAEIFGVGVSFMTHPFRTLRDGVSPVHHNDSTTFSLNEEQLETLQAAVEVCPDATLEELQRFIADDCNVTVSQMTICRALKKLNLPLVKRGGKIDHFRPPGQSAAIRRGTKAWNPSTGNTKSRVWS
jgi:transposase